MIPSRRDGTVSSRLAGKLAEARCCVFMKKFTLPEALIENAGNLHTNACSKCMFIKTSSRLGGMKC